MNTRVAALLLFVSVASTGCFVPQDARPGVGIGGTFASKFVHRGMTQVDAPVFQPNLSVSLPTTTGDTIGLTAKGNMDLTDDNGDAWFPRGHGGRFSEIDFVATYQRQVVDGVDVVVGLFNYNLPNGLEFANDGRGGPGEERGGTSEVFMTVSADVLGARPYFTWNYDFDEVRASYYRAGIGEDFPIDDQFWVELDGSLGYVTSGQANWLYDIDQSGWADLRGYAKLHYRYDANTDITAGVHGSAIINRRIDRWFNAVGIFDDDPIWFSVSVNWSF
ncbi:MAG TPA: hypothetical protein ENI87_02895 [bacterium]|nr:hypothetical protein [bacterium]